MTIFEKHIECPMTPNIKFKELSQILMDNAGKEKYRERSFGMKYNGNIFNFFAKNNRKRNQIFSEILSKFPSNDSKRAHWKTMQLATENAALNMNGKEHRVSRKKHVLAKGEGTQGRDDDMRLNTSDEEAPSKHLSSEKVNKSYETVISGEQDVAPLGLKEEEAQLRSDTQDSGRLQKAALKLQHGGQREKPSKVTEGHRESQGSHVDAMILQNSSKCSST